MTQNQIKKIYLTSILILIFIGLFLYTNYNKDNQETVKIGYLPIAASIPLYVAQEKGYFVKENLNIELIEFQTSNQLTEALIRGDIDVEAPSSSSVTMTVLQNNPDALKIFMVNSFDVTNSISALIVKNNSNITSVKDLKGKIIGSFPGSTTTTYTRLYLEKNGVYSENTQIIGIAPNLQLQALATGNIDAIMALEPTPTLGKSLGLVKILIHAPIETEILNPFVAGSYSFNTEFAKTDKAKKVEKALNQGVDYIRKEPQKSKLILTKYTFIKDENIAIQVPLPNILKKEEINIDNFQKMADLLLSEKILEKRVNVTTAIFNN